MKLSDNLRRIRKENNLSQEQLAEKLGVSRQAVSKWESGQSYPEMDKVLLICKLFNYNIDELMNENIKEVDETKQSKININKYIDDFFAFITKTIDMLSSMKFRQKIKCLIEQIVVGIFLFMLFLIIGAIGSSVMHGIFGNIMPNIYYTVREILESIYIVLALVIGVTILLHIFKIRYLDYYEIIKEDDNKDEIEKENNETEKQEENNEKKKIFIEKKKEKIIIRDPNHSQSKFLTGIFRMVLWCIKFIAICIGIGFVFSFVGLVSLLVLSFLFVKTGLLFLGSFLGIVSVLTINFIILELFYNFIVNKKSKKTRMAISFIIALTIAGISIGMILIGSTKFNYIRDEDSYNEIEDVYEFKMSENLSIDIWNSAIKYVEEDTEDIKIVVKHSKYLTTYITNDKDMIEVYCHKDEAKTMEAIRDFIENINNKEIKDYYPSIVYVYASQENIDKILQNNQNRYNAVKEEEINELNLRIEEMEEEIYELENEIEEKNDIIEALEEQMIFGTE